MKHLKMKHLKIFTIVMLLAFLSTGLVFAQDSEVIQEEYFIPEGIHNNVYHVESVRLTKLAHDAFEQGHYEASAGFAREAVYYTILSDEYVSEQLLAEANRLLVYAEENNFDRRFPNNYTEGKNHYENAVSTHATENFDESIDSSKKSIAILAAFESGRPVTDGTTSTPSVNDDGTSKPRQYTVRSWRVEGDCLSNIAGYPWVYNDPYKWTVLYEANKHNMPEPNNPHLIHPGMVLEIPSLDGEEREGMYKP